MTANFHQRFECELVLIRGADRAEVLRGIAEAEALLARMPQPALADIAYTISTRAVAADRCLGLLATDVADLAKKLAMAKDKLSDPAAQKLQAKSGVFYYEQPLAAQGKVGFVFPGEGAQYVNMLLDLCVHFPEMRAAFDLVDAAVAEIDPAFRPGAQIFPPRVEEGSHEALFDMATAIEAVTAADLALASLLEQLEIKADAVCGHSSGEFAALDFCGVLRHEDDASRRAIIRRGFENIRQLESRTDIPEGTLITVGGATREKIDAQIAASAGRVVLAMDNCPHQFVLCAKADRVDAVMQELSAGGAIVGKLEFNRPYHTEWFSPALDGIRSLLVESGLHAARIPAYSCLNAGLFPVDARGIEALAVGQWASCVRFTETVRAMYRDGVRVFVEVGPRGNLSAFVNDILSGEPALAVPLNRVHRSGLSQLVFALAQLAAHGVKMNPARLFEVRGCTRIGGPVAKMSARSHIFPPSTPPMKIAKIPMPAAPAAVAPLVSPAASGLSLPMLPPGAALELGEDDLAAVVDSYFGTLNEALVAHSQLMAALVDGDGVPLPAAPEPVSPVAVDPAPTPLLTEIVEHVQGEKLVALGRYNVEEHIFLKDHALGRGQVSLADRALDGFAIMPLTMSLTILAEAARALLPGKVVTGLKDIRANKWVSFENGARNVRVTATMKVRGAVTEVHASLREDDPNDPRLAFKPPMNEAIILLADAYPPAPQAPKFDLQGEKPCGWKGSEIYPDRLFHGPMFQGITSIDRWGENGVTGTVMVLPRNELIRSEPDPLFAMDGIFLDTVGGVLGLWGAFDKYDGYVFLPFRIQGVQWYQPLMQPGARFDVHLEVVKRGDMSASADIYAYDRHGRVVLGIQGWEDRDFYVTPGLHKLTHEPLRYQFSEEIPLPADMGLPADAVACASPESLPKDFFTSGHRVWEHVLSMIVLSREERAFFRAMKVNDQRKAEWVLGRTAVKDAVRLFLQRRHELRVGAADVEIVLDDRGKPSVTGYWKDRVPGEVAVGIAHSNGTAVAVAWDARHGAAGIDLEFDRALADALVADTFTKAEQGLGPVVALWTLKEAAAKATGEGIRHKLSELTIVRAGSNFALTPSGPWISVTAGRNIPASSMPFRGGWLAIAVALTSRT